MPQKIAGLIILLTFLIVIPSCQKESLVTNSRLVVGIQADVQTFNPLYAFSLDEGSINELLFLSLVSFDWDEMNGDIIPQPMLAESWEWNNDSTSLTFYLRDDILWSDSIKVTADDVVYSFGLYSDPAVQSKMLGSFKSLFLEDDGSIDLQKSFTVHTPYILSVNFNPASSPTFHEIIFPVIPKHSFEKLKREEISTAQINFEPVTNGPYKLVSWKKNQSIKLVADENSFLQKKESIKEIIYKIIPDYNSRLNQLKKGEIDITELIKPDDIKEIKNSKHLIIKPVGGRDYDYIGWNNIDPVVFNNSKKIIPNKLFGDTLTRRALTLAINRVEILNEYLSGYGQLAKGPVSPIFKYASDTSHTPYAYDVKEAKELLKQAGWKDENNNGVLERNNLEFKFTLHIPSGNPRRSYAGAVVKNNLKMIGVDVTIQTLEIGVLIEDMYSRKIDAWMVGLFVPIPLDLRSFWYSDLENSPMNFAGYRNEQVDLLIEKTELRISTEERNSIIKEIQKIIHEDEPVTFLYWMDNIVVYNNKLNNVDINPLGVVHHCWNWTIK